MSGMNFNKLKCIKFSNLEPEFTIEIDFSKINPLNINNVKIYKEKVDLYTSHYLSAFLEYINYLKTGKISKNIKQCEIKMYFVNSDFSIRLSINKKLVLESIDSKDEINFSVSENELNIVDESDIPWDFGIELIKGYYLKKEANASFPFIIPYLNIDSKFLNNIISYDSHNSSKQLTDLSSLTKENKILLCNIICSVFSDSITNWSMDDSDNMYFTSNVFGKFEYQYSNPILENMGGGFNMLIKDLPNLISLMDKGNTVIMALGFCSVHPVAVRFIIGKLNEKLKGLLITK